jgi:demethylmenaquinone methyltransferase/2-methoxy-6-polyprenyl-1,4-benzoquinol methylase
MEECMLTEPAGDRNRFAQQLFSPLPKRYDKLAEVLSMGQNRRWRRAMVDRIVPASPTLILDVASGTAGVALQLATRTSSDVVGVDLTQNMLARGKENVAEAGMSERISLVAGRAEQLPFPDGTFDALTFTYLLRYVDDPQTTLSELARVVKPGGAISSLEILVVALHPHRPPPGRPDHRWPRMVPSRTVPRPQHLPALPEVSPVVDGGGVAEGRVRKRRRARDESRRRSGHVGHAQT